MATKKFSELTVLDTVNANLVLTVIPVYDTSSNTTRKVTLQQINDSIEANIPFAAAAFTQANTPSHVANSASSYANASFSKANTPSDVANSASSYANSAFGVANTANSNAISASQYANAAFAVANSGITDSWARDTANSASSYANSAYSVANTANTNVVTADQKAVTSGAYANAPYGQANTSNTLAQQSYDAANTKVSKSGDTMTGDLKFGGGGGIFNMPTNQIAITANVDNDVSGFFAQATGISTVYANTDVTIQANTGGAVTSVWTFNSTGSLTFPDSTIQSTAFTGYGIDNVARYTANSAESYANSAFTQANTPSHVANSASSYANGAFTQANTPSHVANSASSYANGAFSTANSSNTYVASYAAIWDTSPPTTIQSAIDRLANAIYILNSNTPIL